MEFRDFAAAETSALISRLLGRRSEESLQQLRSVRDALAAAEQALEESPKVDKDIREFVGRIVNAAGAAIKHVREESKAALESVRGELATERAEREKLANALTQLQDKADDLSAKLRQERDRAVAAERDLGAAREAHAEVDAERQKAEELLDAANAETAALSNQLIDETATAFSLRSELASLQQGLDAANAKAKEAAAQIAAAKASAEREIKEATAQHVKARAAAERELKEANEQMAAVKAAAEREIKEATAQHVKARAAAEHELKEAAEQLAAVKAAAEREIQESTAQLAKAREAAERQLKEAADQLAAVKAAAEREIRESTAQLAKAQAAAEREVSELTEQLTEMGEAREAADRELQEVREKLEATQADVGRLGAQLEASAGERGRLLTSLSAAQGELGTAQEQREGLAAQLKSSQARSQTLERSEAQHLEQIRQLEARLKEATQAEAALRSQAASHQQESAGRQAEIATLGQEAERARAVFDACLRGAEELGVATTVAALLGALAKQLATQFSRVAVFRLKGNRLEGEHQVGFDQTKDVTKLIIPLSMDSMITRVVSSGAVESVAGKQPIEAGTPLGGTPSTAVSLPIVFHGQTIAVVYADDSGQKATAQAAGGADSRVGFARVMLAQTGVLLLRLTHELKTLADLREYATQLLQEAAQMHSVDAAAGKNADEVRRRLKGTIDWARQLFAERVTLAGGLGAAVLDEQIGASLEKQATPFAKDLASVVGRARGPQRAAEAS
jgi:chromosome segregation ATPase